MTKYYSGVGSRATPEDVLSLMEKAAAWLAAEGWTLRSGHAAGADRAFERGAGGKAVVYLPWSGFGQKPYGDDPGTPVLGMPHVVGSEEMDRAYERLVRAGIRSRQVAPKMSLVRLHGRNLYQVLGHTPYCKPSAFVVCWCEEKSGKPQGGTATAVNLAKYHNIDVINLWREADRRRLEEKLK